MTRKASRSVLLAISLAATMASGWACGAGGSSSASSTPAAHVVASVPSSELAQPGKLLICSDIPAAPFEQYDSKGQLQGFDVDMGNELSARIGLQPVWVNSVFDTIIEALQGGKCDAIISSMFVTAERQKQIHQIPYFTAGESFMVAKGNAAGIDPNNPTTLCGQTVATELGAAEVDDANAYSKQCTSAGKQAINLIQSTKFDDALQQLQTGHAVALFYDSPVNAYYVHQQPSTFEIAGNVVLKPVLYGIGVDKSHSGLISALVTALQSEQSDGFFARILAKWGQSGVTIPTPS